MKSKPDPVDQPERTAPNDCAMCTALLKCYTILQHRDSSVNIPLPPDQHHSSGGGEGEILVNAAGPAVDVWVDSSDGIP